MTVPGIIARRLLLSSLYSDFVKFGGITSGTISKDLYQCNVLWVSKGLVDVFFQDAHCFEELLLVRVPMTLKMLFLSVFPLNTVPVLHRWWCYLCCSFLDFCVHGLYHHVHGLFRLVLHMMDVPHHRPERPVCTHLSSVRFFAARTILSPFLV
jgi:hypothetical protein